LLSLRAAGLCGSDLHMHYRPAPEDRHGPVFGLTTDPEVVPGHEAAGVVAATGPDVTSLRVGDRVAVHHMAGCGDCMHCRRGWDINCQRRWGVYGLDRPGAMQDYMVVRSRDCARVPAGVSFEEAAYYTCGAGTGYLSLRRAGLGIGDTVGIVGLGPVGVAAAHFAASAGNEVIGLDVVPSRLDFAAKVTGCVALDAAGENVRPLVERGAQGEGLDIVIESSGSASGRAMALEMAAIGARVVFVGFADTENMIDVQRTIIQKQLDVRGAWMFPLPELQRMLDDVGARGLSIDPLVTGRYGIEEAAAAWAAFDRGGPGKTVLTWPAGDR
jgi:threonine dehydrogenase-like Zn-dependent dehydrogenase